MRSRVYCFSVRPHLTEKSEIQTISAKENFETKKRQYLALTDDIFRPSNITCLNLLVSCRVPFLKVCPEYDDFETFLEKIERSNRISPANSQVKRKCSAWKGSWVFAACIPSSWGSFLGTKEAKEIREIARSLPRISGEVQEFCACKAQNAVDSRSVVYARAQDAVISIHASARNVPFPACKAPAASARNAVISRHFMHARAPNAVSRNFVVEGVEKLQLQAQIALASEDLGHARLKMSGFQEFCLLKPLLHQLGSKQHFWTNSGPDVDDPSCHETHLCLQSLFRDRTNIDY